MKIESAPSIRLEIHMSHTIVAAYDSSQNLLMSIFVDGSTWIPTQAIIAGLRSRAEIDGHRHDHRRHQGIWPTWRRVLRTNDTDHYVGKSHADRLPGANIGIYSGKWSTAFADVE